MSNLERGGLPLPEEKRKAAEVAWLGESQNLAIVWPAASSGYSRHGRGAVVVNGLEPLNEIRYCPQRLMNECEDETARQVIEQYNPDRELVAIFLQEDNRVSCYRVEVGDEAVLRAVRVRVAAREAKRDLGQSGYHTGYTGA